MSIAEIACEGSACSLPTSSAQSPVDIDAFLDGSSGAPSAQVVQMAGGRVISRQGRNHSYLMWQGGKDEGGATDWNATGHLRWGQEQRYVLHPHETHGSSETWSSNRLVISVTTLPVEKG